MRTTILILVLLFIGCGEGEVVDIAQGHCFEACFQLALDHLSDADHLQGISAEAVEKIAGVCREANACKPCRFERGIGRIVTEGNYKLCKPVASATTPASADNGPKGGV